MYKKKNTHDLDNLAISITSTLCDMVEMQPFTESFNNFEVIIEQVYQNLNKQYLLLQNHYNQIYNIIFITVHL